jgi:anti-sigma regulatory factor (Ser/Thr protein kinase)
MTVALQLTIRNDLAELPRVEELARSLLDSAGIAEDKAFTASVALEEALSNVIRHGFDDGAVHEISVRIGVEDDAVVLEERAVGGLGLHLLHNMVGDIRYERSGGRNHLRLCI